MIALAKLLTAVSIPLMLLNALGGLVSGVWLIALGQWRAVVIGIITMMVSAIGLGFAMLPGMIFALPATYFERRRITSGLLVCAFLGALYSMLVITVWCTVVLVMFMRQADSFGSLAALLLWSYGIALGPVAFLAQKDAENEYSHLSTVFAEIAYLLTIVLVLVLNISVSTAFATMGAVMVLAAVVEVVIAQEQQRLQESGVSRLHD